MIAFLGLVFGIILLMFIGGIFGYTMWRIKVILVKLSKIELHLRKQAEPKASGVTLGSSRPFEEPTTTSNVITPKTPQQIEAEQEKKLRDQGYNV